MLRKNAIFAPLGFLCLANVDAFTSTSTSNRAGFGMAKLQAKNDDDFSLRNVAASAALACSLFFGAMDPAHADGASIMRQYIKL